MTSCLTHIEAHLSQILTNSGRTFGRVGNYKGCIITPNMDYYLISVISTTEPPLPLSPVGLCLPEECSADAIKNILSTLFTDTNLPLKVTSVHSHVPDFHFDYDWTFFLTMIMISCLLAMVLLSTFVKTVRNHKIMGAFAIQNSMKIFNYQESSLNTLNGVRSLMMLWVVFSHEYAFSLNNSENLFSFAEIVSQWQFIIIVSGYFSVDAFFFIGGFLVAYAFLKEQSTSFFKYPLAIFNRFLRLIPAYFVAIMIYYSVFPHLGSGPLWYQLQQQTITPCDNGWWKSLLFINNLTDHLGDICLGWGWYLQNDMQLFVYCVFLLAIYSYNKMAGYLSIAWSMLASFAYSMVVTYTNQLHNNNKAEDVAHSNLMSDTLYISPWSRAPPYLFGLLLGILYVNFLF